MKSLKSFAAYLLNEFLEEYTIVYLSHIQSLNIPLMKLFDHLSAEELRELSKPEVIKFLEGFVNGTSLEKAAESLKQWETDSIPGIPKNKIHPSDLVLIYTAQKFALYDFISMHVSNSKDTVVIIREMEQYYSIVQNNAVKLLFKMQRE